MKAARFLSRNNMRIEEIQTRAPLPDEAVVKIAACGVCGTDLHIYQGAEGAVETVPPITLGHEFSGIVCEVGSTVTTVKTGDRVCIDPNDTCGKCYYCKAGKAHFCESMTGIGTTVDGGFAEYCTVKEKQLYKVPAELSFEEAAMAEPVACCLHGINLASITAGQTVMILGGGTIGLIMLQLAKISGVSNLILVEPVESKRILAKRLGADVTIDPVGEFILDILDSLREKSIDAVIECVGLKSTMQDAIKYVGKGGTAILFGLTSPECDIPLKPFDLFRKEITVKASFINPYTQERALSLLRNGKIDVKSLISDTIRLDDICTVFENEEYRRKGKIIIKP
jgi:L-iditol 2-dehydrogenase